MLCMNMKDKDAYVSKRTIQLDIQLMRSDKLRL